MKWQHWTTQRKIVEKLDEMAKRLGRPRLALDPCSNAAAITGASRELWGPESVALVPYLARAHSMIERSHAEHESMGKFHFRPDWARKVHKEEREAIALDAARGGLTADLERLAQEMSPGRDVFLQDGLEADWFELSRARDPDLDGDPLVYMNSPFATGVVDRWVDKAATSGEQGLDVVGMVANATAARWFHDHVFARCSAGLFLRGRLSFENAPPDAKGEGASVQNVLVHWGPNVQAFFETFEGMGEMFSMRASKRAMQWRCTRCEELQAEPQPVVDEEAA